MRDDHPLLHTPHRSRTKHIADRNQKQQKSSSRKDSIDISTLSEVSEDNHVTEYTEVMVFDSKSQSIYVSCSRNQYVESSRKDSIDTSTFLVVCEDNHVADSSESFITSLSPFDSPSSVHPPSSGIAPLSSTNSAATAEPPDLSINRYGCLQSDSEVASSLEKELVVKHLQQLMLHTPDSADTDLRYKKLLVALVESVVEGFLYLPEERHWFTEIISRKTLTVFLSLTFWILVISTAFLFSKFAQSSYSSGPPPT